MWLTSTVGPRLFLAVATAIVRLEADDDTDCRQETKRKPRAQDVVVDVFDATHRLPNAASAGDDISHVLG